MLDDEGLLSVGWNIFISLLVFDLVDILLLLLALWLVFIADRERFESSKLLVDAIKSSMWLSSMSKWMSSFSCFFSLSNMKLTFAEFNISNVSLLRLFLLLVVLAFCILFVCLLFVSEMSSLLLVGIALDWLDDVSFSLVWHSVVDRPLLFSLNSFWICCNMLLPRLPFESTPIWKLFNLDEDEATV